jgi:hypothetical protein
MKVKNKRIGMREKRLVVEYVGKEVIVDNEKQMCRCAHMAKM